MGYAIKKNEKLYIKHEDQYEVTGITCVADVTDSLDETYFVMYDESGSVGFWIDTDDSGTTIPAGASACDRAVEITSIVTDMSAIAVAAEVYAAIIADSKFGAGVDNEDATIEIKSSTVGTKTNASAGDSGFTMSEETIGSEAGTYTAPDANSDAIQFLDDSLTMEPSREVLERNVSSAGIGKMKPRLGMKGASGSLSVEMKANGTEGNAPEFGLLIEAAFGATRSAVTKTASDADGGSYSSTVICLANADKNIFAVGDSVITKRSENYHCSPISSISNDDGDVNITLLIADPAGAYVDDIVIAAVTTYLPADSGHKPISFTKYVEDAVREYSAGSKITSLAMSNFATGKFAQFDFGFEGEIFNSAVSAMALSPTYDSALPPLVVEAIVYQDGVAIEVNEVAFALENTLGWITSTQDDNGRVSSRVTARAITGSFNPYKKDDSVANFTKYEAGTEFSLFLRAYIPSATSGEYGDCVAIYMPNCQITALTQADADGVLQEAISFQANATADNSEREIYVSFI